MATDLRRDVTPVRLPNPSAQPFVAALKTARFFAVVFLWVTMVALLAHLAAFVLVEWVQFYDPPSSSSGTSAAGSALGDWGSGLEGVAAAAPAPPGPAPAAPIAPPAAPPAPTGPAASPKPPPAAPAAPIGPAAAPPEPPPAAEPQPQPPEAPKKEGPPTPRDLARQRQDWRLLTAQLIEPLRVLGMLCAILLWVTMFIYLEIGLLGRLSGIREVTGAFFVMLLVLATVLPWHTWFAELPFGSFYRFADLWEAHGARLAGQGQDLLSTFRYYGRFLVLPMLSTALLIIAGLRFGRGYVESVVVNE